MKSHQQFNKLSSSFKKSTQEDNSINNANFESQKTDKSQQNRSQQVKQIAQVIQTPIISEGLLQQQIQTQKQKYQSQAKGPKIKGDSHSIATSSVSSHRNSQQQPKVHIDKQSPQQSPRNNNNNNNLSQNYSNCAKRMTTINEIAREEGGSFECVKNNMSQNQNNKLSREETTPEVSCKDFFQNCTSDQKNEIENELKGGLEKQFNAKQLKETALLNQDQQYEQQIFSIKLSIEKNKKKKSIQKPQKDTSIKNDALLKSLVQLEKIREEGKVQVLEIQKEKEKIIQQMQQLSHHKNKSNKKEQVVPQVKKENKLLEMETLIKDMARKLEEKDKVIAQTQQQQLEQTQCLKELQLTVKLLQSKNLITPQNEDKPQTNIPSIKKQETFSPKANSKKLFDKNSQSFNVNVIHKQGQKHKFGGGGPSSSSQMHTLSESNSLSLLHIMPSLQESTLKHQQSIIKGLDLEVRGASNYSQLDDKSKSTTLKRLEKKKNNSTANLFKRTKPTVMISIQQQGFPDEKVSESGQSHNNSLLNNNNQMDSCGMKSNTNNMTSGIPMILQQTVTNKMSKHNKMSMVVTSTNNISGYKGGSSLWNNNEDNSSNKSQKIIIHNLLNKKPTDHTLKENPKQSQKQSPQKGKNSEHIADDLDEGVQNFKKSIVPIRCISNLMQTNGNIHTNNFDSHTYSSTSTLSRAGIANNSFESQIGSRSMKKKASLKSSKSGSSMMMLSPKDNKNITARQKNNTMKIEVLAQDSSLTKQNSEVGGVSLQRETSLKAFHRKSQQIINQKQNTGKLQQIQSDEMMEDQVKNTTEERVIKIELKPSNNNNNRSNECYDVQESEGGEENVTRNDESFYKMGNDELQNTPPRIKQKMSQLASKNKFEERSQKPKNTIEIQIKGSMVLKSENNQSVVHVDKYRTEKSQVVSQCKKGTLKDQIKKEEDIMIYEKRKQERKDNFVRKSFELMNTLKCSADQASQLKPINRTAARLGSFERSGQMSVKNTNTCTQSQSFTAKVCGLQQSKSPQQNFDGMDNIHYTMMNSGQPELIASNQLDFQLHSKTMDNRNNLSANIKANAMVKCSGFVLERKITDLKEARIRNRSSQSNNRNFITNDNPISNGDDNQLFGHFNQGNEASKSGNLLSQELEQKISDLDNLFKSQSTQNNSKLHQSQSNQYLNSSIKEQILVKCLKNPIIDSQNKHHFQKQLSISGSQSNLDQMIQHKYLHNQQALLKCNSNDKLNNSVQNLNFANNSGLVSTTNAAPVMQRRPFDRPRSITIEQQMRPTHMQNTILMNDGQNNNGHNIMQIQNLNSSNGNIPKWTELASIIKRNLSPTSMNNNNEQQVEDPKAIALAMDIEQQYRDTQNQQLNIQSQKGYMVKYNKIDLSKTSPCNQSMHQQQTNTSKPPTNPQAISKKRKEWDQKLCNEDQDNQKCILPNSSQPQIQRGRSESQYLPIVSKQLQIRTPRGHNPSQLGLQSPASSAILNKQNQDKINNAEQNYNMSSFAKPSSILSLGTPSNNLSQSQQFSFGAFKSNIIAKQNQYEIQGNSNDHLNHNYYHGYQNKAQLMQNNINVLSSSADFPQGFFNGLISPSYNAEPIGNRDKAKPEITELIERQRSRLNSQHKKMAGGGNDSMCGNLGSIENSNKQGNGGYPNVIKIQISDPQFK